MKLLSKSSGGLDLHRLQNVQDRGDKITAACPACQQQGADRLGEHLVIYRDGKYGCIKSKDDSHRRRIFQLSGNQRNGKQQFMPSKPRPLTRNEWADLKKMSRSRALLEKRFGFSGKALDEAIRRGVLHVGTITGSPVWTVTDSARYARQDQRLNGEPIDEEKKKRTLGTASWPVGLDQAAKFKRWVLTEGNTDFLAAFELMARGGLGNPDEIGIACFFGAGAAANPHPDVIEKLAGKDVFIAFDNDDAGNRAARKLAAALKDTAGRIGRFKILEGCDLRDMVMRSGVRKLPVDDMRAIETDAAQPTLIRTDEDAIFKSAEKLNALTPEVVLDGLLHAGSKLMIGGVAKIGKSLFAMDLAARLSKGKKFLNWQPSRKMSVVYVDAELHEWELKQRAGRALDQNPSGQFDLLSLRRFPQWRHWDQLTEFLTGRGEKPDVIVIDCLYKFNEAEDENSNTGMKQVGEKLDILHRETGAAIVLVHHFGKGDQSSKETLDRFRGASALVGEMDALISVTRHEEEGHYIVEAEARSFPQPRRFVARLLNNHFLKTDKDPAKKKKPGHQQQFTDEQIRELLPLGQRVELIAIAETLKVTPQAINKRLAEMKDIVKFKAKAKESTRTVWHLRRNSPTQQT